MKLEFLLDTYPMDKHYFLIPRFALRLIGFYPETEWNVWVKLWALFNTGILGYGCYVEFYYGVYYLPIDIPTALDAFCPVASSIMSFIKIFFIWWYRDEYNHLIKEVRRLTESQNSPGKMRVKRKYFTIATQLTALVLFFGIVTTMTYTIRPIFTNTKRYLNGEDILYETPFKMMFPDRLLTMPIYPLTFILSNWHGYITVLSFVGGDGLFLGFCFYFTVLLKALPQDLNQILDVNAGNASQKAGRSNSNKQSEAEICSKLTKIIERHNEIADLTAKFSSVMVEITLCHFITSSVIIGTSVVDILVFSGYGVVLYVVYTCAVLTEIFLYCLGGTAVMESSEELGTKAYSTQWYAHSVKVQKIVLLIIVRAQRTIIVKVPFFAPSLPALTAILRFTGSLIALVTSII